MSEWTLGQRLDGPGVMGYTGTMLRVSPALLACTVMLACAWGCSLDQSAIAPAGDAGVPPRPVDGGDGGPDTGLDGARDGGLDGAMARDTSIPRDTSGPDGSCLPFGGGVELCNGIDDDCDPATADGTGDPAIGGPCDGADDDLCEEGVRACVGGMPVCDDTTGNIAETCNGFDDDCDGTVDEGVSTLYYVDADRDGYGVDGTAAPRCGPADGFALVGGDCDDSNDLRRPGLPEQCTMRDTNCNGEIDEGCTCTSVIRAGRLYSFCTGGRNYDAARSLCMGRGQDLARIEDMAENDFIVGEVYARGLNVAYVGLHDEGHEGDWRWAAEEALTYTAWAPGEPNDSCSPSCDEDCGVVGWAMGAPASSWNDVNCWTDHAAVCEGPAP